MQRCRMVIRFDMLHHHRFACSDFKFFRARTLFAVDTYAMSCSRAMALSATSEHHYMYTANEKQEQIVVRYTSCGCVFCITMSHVNYP